MKRVLVGPLLLVGGLGGFCATPAAAGFVEAYASANGGCALFREGFGREIGAPQPFGRPLEAWEPRDVSELESIGLSCVAGPPPIMPESPGSRLKRAVASFRRAVDEARRLKNVSDGQREMETRIAVSQAQDRLRRDANGTTVVGRYNEVTANRVAQQRQAEIGLAERRAAMDAQRDAFQAQERERRERAMDSRQETERRTQQMVAERAASERRAEEQAHALVDRVRAALRRLKEASTAEAIGEIATLRSEIGAIQSQTRGQLGSDLFILDTDLLDAGLAIKQRQAAQGRRESSVEGTEAERPATVPEQSPIDAFIVTVRPGISEFGNLTVSGLRKCFAKAPGGRNVTVRQDGHPNRYIIRTEGRSDVSWAEFVALASGGQAYISEVRGYSAETRNNFHTQNWLHIMPTIVRACA